MQDLNFRVYISPPPLPRSTTPSVKQAYIPYCMVVVAKGDDICETLGTSNSSFLPSSLTPLHTTSANTHLPPCVLHCSPWGWLARSAVQKGNL